MVKHKKREVIWSDIAKEQLKEIYKYVKKDSETAAKQVKNKILSSTKILSTGEEIYKADELKLDNTGAYRAYVIFSYRITYKISKNLIEILRVRHTCREPLEH